MNKANANNEVLTLHPIVLRLNPITNTPLVFIADKPPVNDRVEMVAEGGKHMIVDTLFYSHTLPLPDDMADKVSHEYADMVGVPYESLHVRARLPKKITKRTKRQTNDANMQDGSGAPFRRRATDVQEQPKQESVKDSGEAKNDELANAAQALHDSETGKEEEKGEATASNNESGRATASNPEGATVSPRDNVTPIRQKRAYNKRTTEEKMAKAQKSKRSMRALERYQADLRAAAEKNELVVEKAASNVSPEQYDEEVLKLAAVISKIIKANPDIV